MFVRWFVFSFSLFSSRFSSNVYKTKSPGFAGTSLSSLVIFYNNTLLLKSRLGSKKVVVKVKECVVDFHFCLLSAIKIKGF